MTLRLIYLGPPKKEHAERLATCRANDLPSALAGLSRALRDGSKALLWRSQRPGMPSCGALTYRETVKSKESMMMETVSLLAALDTVTEHWSPKVVGRVNDQYIKVAKLLGQLVWHKHDEEDELFQVVRGRLCIQFEGGRTVDLASGEFCVVPRGVMHNPVAAEECWIVLIETVTTRHTGDVVTSQTRSVEAQLA